MKYHKQLLTTILLMPLALAPACLHAGTMNDVINHYRVRGNKIIKDKKMERSPTGRNPTECNSFNQPAPQVIIFISLTMPELSIKQIIQDAARYEIPIVIRGLYRNSFKETMNKIFDLVKDKNKGGILINPRWFKQYEIKSVPVVVVSQANRFDVVYGNVHLKKALEIVAERGDLAAAAKQILDKNRP